MKVLVIGGGGREHALVWSLSKSQRVTEIVCAPGNAGMAALARCVAVDQASVADMLRVVQEEGPGFVVIGPELPLSLGIVDALRERGVRVFGPTQAGARLESSKGFAKDFMQRWKIPTAAYAVCASIDEVRAALVRFGPRVVVKADGLAAGKGVLLCETHQEALRGAEELFAGELLGTRADRVVLEEMLNGPETSFFTICDGTTAVTLAAAQDHKRVGEGDTGPNTGGMGAYTLDGLLTEEQTTWLLEHVAQRVVDGMRAEETPFSGVLFTGVMWTEDGPMVLEFNTRFGDPETQAILVRLETDLLEILEAAAAGHVGANGIRLKPGASVSVIAANAGYPTSPRGGGIIHGLADVLPGVEVFHSGTTFDDGHVLATGGRVLAVTAAGESLRAALDEAYAALKMIGFEKMHYRRDIGWRALTQQRREVSDAAPARLA